MSLLRHSVVISALLLAGCQSYTIVQRNIFADDNGYVVSVEYGRSESDHVNTFVSPVTGKEMDFKSKLMVRVTLPDGDRIKAWQCMNFLAMGTMYQTDDEEWKVLANGFSVIVYVRTEEEPYRYVEAYRGVLCDIADVEVKKDDRWRDITHTGKRQYKKSAPTKK